MINDVKAPTCMNCGYFGIVFVLLQALPMGFIEHLHACYSHEYVSMVHIYKNGRQLMLLHCWYIIVTLYYCNDDVMINDDVMM